MGYSRMNDTHRRRLFTGVVLLLIGGCGPGEQARYPVGKDTLFRFGSGRYNLSRTANEISFTDFGVSSSSVMFPVADWLLIEGWLYLVGRGTWEIESQENAYICVDLQREKMYKYLQLESVPREHRKHCRRLNRR